MSDYVLNKLYPGHRRRTWRWCGNSERGLWEKCFRSPFLWWFNSEPGV